MKRYGKRTYRQENKHLQRKGEIKMTKQGKKEVKIEEVSCVAGGNAVGPVKENRPGGNIDPFNYPNELETGPLMPGPMHKTGSLIDK